MRYLWAHGGPRKRERASSRVAAIRRWCSKGFAALVKCVCIIPVARANSASVCRLYFFVPDVLLLVSCASVTIIGGHDTRPDRICIRSSRPLPLIIFRSSYSMFGSAKETRRVKITNRIGKERISISLERKGGDQLDKILQVLIQLVSTSKFQFVVTLWLTLYSSWRLLFSLLYPIFIFFRILATCKYSWQISPPCRRRVENERIASRPGVRIKIMTRLCV